MLSAHSKPDTNQEVFEIIRKNQEELLFLLFMTNACLMGKNASAKNFVIEEASKSIAEYLTRRKEYLLKSVQESLKISLKNQSEHFMEVFKEFIRQRAELNLVPVSRYIAKLMQPIQKFASASYRIQSLRNYCRESVLTFKVLSQEQQKSDEEILKYMLGNRQLVKVPKNLATLVEHNPAWNTLIDWAKEFDAQEIKTGRFKLENRENEWRTNNLSSMQKLVPIGLLACILFACLIAPIYPLIISTLTAVTGLSKLSILMGMIFTAMVSGTALGRNSRQKTNKQKDLNEIAHYKEKREVMTEQLNESLNQFFDIKIVLYENKNSESLEREVHTVIFTAPKKPSELSLDIVSAPKLAKNKSDQHGKVKHVTRLNSTAQIGKMNEDEPRPAVVEYEKNEKYIRRAIMNDKTVTYIQMATNFFETEKVPLALRPLFKNIIKNGGVGEKGSCLRFAKNGKEKFIEVKLRCSEYRLFAYQKPDDKTYIVTRFDHGLHKK